MCDRQNKFLNLPRLPILLTPEQFGWLMGRTEHDVRQWMAAGLIEVLADPAQNAAKWIWCQEYEDLRNDKKRLTKCVQYIYDYWHTKSENKVQPPNEPVKLKLRKRNSGNDSDGQIIQ